ncbi:MAG: AAA family ATPase [Anaerolineae bacterium]
MEIRAVELENVKSYSRERIAFAHGTNAICGANGAGKSTILEAIGYALFDHAPCRPISNMVREGERSGRITVTVLADDEREYEVVRQVGGSNQYYVYDPELRQKIAAGKDVRAWLCEQFGVEENADLPALFRDAVGVPQGLLTAPFLQTAEKRKATFDPLLRVEEYSQAFSRLLDARHALDERLQALRERLAGLAAQVERLPALEQRLGEWVQALADAETRLQALHDALAEWAARELALRQAQERVHTLERQGARLQERVCALHTAREHAAQAFELARAAQDILKQNAAGHAAYEAAQERERAMVERAQDRARLQAQLHECQLRREGIEERLRHLVESLQQASEAAIQAERLQPAVAQQSTLEAALQEARIQNQQCEAARHRLQAAERALQEATDTWQRARAAAAERSTLELAREEASKTAAAAQQEIDTLQSQAAHQRAHLEHCTQQQAALVDLAAPQCPVCEAELPPERQEALLMRSREQAAELQAKLDCLTAQLGAQRHRREQALCDMNAADERLAQLPRAEEVTALGAAVQQQEEAVTAERQEVERLAEAAARIPELQSQLQALGDPRRSQQRALDVASQREVLAKKQEQAQSELAELTVTMDRLSGELSAYDTLDADVEKVRAELAANETAHRTYLQHEREAAALAEREIALQRTTDEWQAAAAECSACEQELAAARDAYQPQEHQRLQQALQKGGEERSALQARAQEWRKQIADAQQEMATLQAAAAELQATERELATWQSVGRVLEHLRRVLKEAGPLVTRALVAIISYQAARLYGDILGSHSGRLRWSEDYEIQVEHAGHVRLFPQLSGGEQMAAALAVRLALLREVSSIDLVFFDEPTSNLDETRRENLADQILGIRDLSQLFVVSHDDTFERATDHHIRIAMVDGASMVVD